MHKTETEERRAQVIDRLVSKGGFRARIDAKCCECIYDPISGNGSWRNQVDLCKSVTCPLYGVRTKSKKQSKDES